MNLLLILASLLGYGSSCFSDKLAANRTSNERVITVIILLTALPIGLWTWFNMVHGWMSGLSLPNFKTFCWTFVAALGFVVGLLAYFRALEKSEAGVIIGITASYPIIPIILFAFWGELYVGVVAGALLIALGVALIKKSHIADTVDSALWKDATIATLGFGLSGLADAFAMDSSHNDQTTVFGLVLFFRIAIIIFTLGTSNGEKAPENGISPYLDTRLWGWCAVSNLTYFLHLAAYLAAMTLMPRVAVITATSGYPLVTFLFGVFFLKEQFSLVRLAGIISVVAGTVLATIAAGG